MQIIPKQRNKHSELLSQVPSTKYYLCHFGQLKTIKDSCLNVPCRGTENLKPCDNHFQNIVWYNTQNSSLYLQTRCRGYFIILTLVFEAEETQWSVLEFCECENVCGKNFCLIPYVRNCSHTCHWPLSTVIPWGEREKQYYLLVFISDDLWK